MAEERIDKKSSGSAPEKEEELRRLLFQRLSDLRAQTGELPASISNASPTAQTTGDAAVATPEKEKEIDVPKGSRGPSKLVVPSIQFEDIADDAGEDEDYEDYEDYPDGDGEDDAVLASKTRPDQ